VTGFILPSFDYLPPPPLFWVLKEPGFLPPEKLGRLKLLLPKWFWGLKGAFLKGSSGFLLVLVIIYFINIFYFFKER